MIHTYNIAVAQISGILPRKFGWIIYHSPILLSCQRPFISSAPRPVAFRLLRESLEEGMNRSKVKIRLVLQQGVCAQSLSGSLCLILVYRSSGKTFTRLFDM